jgi:hypothetical protein
MLLILKFTILKNVLISRRFEMYSGWFQQRQSNKRFHDGIDARNEKSKSKLVTSERFGFLSQNGCTGEFLNY